MLTVACPSCGNVDDLQGRREGGGVVITCGACGNTWERDLTPTCTLCGSTDLEAVPTATLEEAGRGDMRTPSGIRDVYRCYRCGAKDATSATPTPDPDRVRPEAVVRVPRHAGSDDDAPTTRPAEGTRRVVSAFGYFAEGETIGGTWRIERLLHWSSTGSLWHAQHVDADRRVVFKLVHPRVTRDPNRLALHASAARAVLEVRHDHLVPVLDVKVTGSQVLVVAAALGTPLDTGATFAPDRLGSTGAALASALAALHDQGVSHLDVRPRSILIDAHGLARLLDLGSGRVRAAVRTRTAGDDRLAFQAPEQILTHDVGPTVDVYSLGLTLWTLGGGTLDRFGGNTGTQASHRLTNDVPALEPDATGLAPGVVAALAAATRRRPDLRPTARELAELLAAG